MPIHVYMVICSQVILQTQAKASVEQNRIVYGRGGYDIEFDFLAVSHSDCSYALLYNGLIFHANDTSVPSTNYPPSKFNRTSIDGQRIFSYQIVTLRLQNLNIRDSGRYTCSVTCPTSAEIQQYQLVVISPPSPASCEWLSAGLSPLGDTTLLCSTVQGYPRGSIVCYTWTCGRAGSFTGVFYPTFMTGHSRQEAFFLIEDTSCTECCSYSERFQKTRDNCHDFIYTPLNRAITKIQEKASITKFSTPSISLTTSALHESPNEIENYESNNCITNAISSSVLIFNVLVFALVLLY